ncbi:MAG: pyridoxamine 5'-phosphate oxidase family protein, partial [Actinomycetota bacterium]
MGAFTDAEMAYLHSQPLMRFASASLSGRPDVAPVVFQIDGDDIVTAGFGFSLYAAGNLSNDLPIPWVLLPARLTGV